MRKVFIVTAVFDPEPVVSSQISLDIALSLSKNEKVTIIHPKPSRPFGFDFQNKIKLPAEIEEVELHSFVAPKSNLFSRIIESYSFGLRSGIYLLKNSKKDDIVYLNVWPIFAQYILLILAKFKRLKVTIHIQDVYPESYFRSGFGDANLIAKFLIMIDNVLMRLASNIVVISSSMKNYYVFNRKISERKIVQICNWSTRNYPELNNLDLTSKSNEFNFVYFGNIGKLSGLQQVIDAFGLVDNVRIRFVIAGEGSEKKILQDYVSNQNVNNVQFVSVDVGDEYQLLSKTNVCILPMTVGSSTFSIPSKLITYTGYSRPVLGYCDYKSGVWDILEIISDGYLVESGNVEKLARTINEMASLPQSKLDSLGQKSFKYYRENYDRNSNLSRLTSVLLSE